MSKLACALAIAALLMLCAPARSADSGLDSSLGMESEMQLQLLETEIAQISVSEKQLHDIVALQAQAGGDELTEAEKGTMAKLQALEQEQKKRMLTDDEFNLPITLMEHHEKCNAQIIEAVLKIFRTAKMQVRSQISKVEAYLTSADYARHLIQMMKFKDQLYRLHQRFMDDAMEITMNFKGGDQSAMVRIKLLQELRNVADNVRAKKLSPADARVRIETLRQSMLEL